MKKHTRKNKKIFIILAIIIITGAIGYILLQKDKPTKPVVNISEVSKETAKEYSVLIENKEPQVFNNIAEYSEEFMEEYFEQSKEINTKNNNENILIVTSKEKVENTYGASSIVEAPNNQYILQYNSEKEKNKALEKLGKSEDILYVEENYIYTLYESDYNSWGIQKMGLDVAIQTAEEESINKMLQDVTVAIIDTGCDMEVFNANYNDKIRETYNLYDGSPVLYDNNGHGTHIAGTIAEGTSSNVKILPIKVSDSKTMDTATIIAAINYLSYYKKADVINMSFGGTQFSKSLYVAIEAANENGIISVAAAGNESTSTNSYPAAFDNTISVSAVDSECNFADFSNYGEMITFTAPGANIESINGVKSGTSMAAPHVACAVAMLKGTNTSLSLEQTTTLLKNTAIDLGVSGWDQYYGYGLINMANFNELISDAGNTDIVDFEVKNTTGINSIYGNITNLMNLEIILKDANGNEYTRRLSDIDDLEIENYDAFVAGEQNIKIKYNNIEKTITVNNGTSGGNVSAYTCYYVDEANSTVSVKISATNIPKKIYIPENINNYKVVSIYAGGFQNAEINAIILPTTVSSIGDQAFANSTIKSITGGASEISLGNNVFYGAYKLEIFEPKISALGQGAFYNASSINNLILSDNIETIKIYAFCNCVSLENINIPNKLVEIQEGAFANTKIKSLNFPKTLVTIADIALQGIIGLETITVDSENPVYDSRENCNALIETSSNTIILGSSSTTVPDTVATIGEYAFYKNIKIEKIDTNKVKEIKDYAFEGCINLKEFYLAETLETLGYHALYNVPKATVYMYNTKFESALYYSDNQVERAICIIPDEIAISCSAKYKTFDKVEDIEINLEYLGFGQGYNLGDFSLSETITQGYTITYPNGGDCFKGGDTYFIVSATTKYGIDIEEKVDVIIEKLTPEYIIPTNITAKAGQQLSEIELPEGFEWMDSTQVVEGEGNVIYKAKFIPEDTDNYEIVENIEITINIQNRTMSEVTVYITQTEYKAFETVKTQGMYIMITYENGTVEYVRDNIIIEYNAGNDSFRYGDTSFCVRAVSESGENIVSRVNITVQKATPEYVIPTGITAEVGQQLSEIQLPEGFTWMDETQIIEGLGNIIYKARYTPNDTHNYEIVENIEIIISIKTGIINNSTDYEGVYDGNEHSINIDVSITDYQIKYSVNNYNYDLDILPTFKDVGEYVVNYKITKDGYEDIIGSNKVKIYGIKGLDSTLELRNDILVIKNYNNSFSKIWAKIDIFATYCECNHYDRAGTLIYDDLTKTGESIKININNLKEFAYKVSVLGDVNGDGKISALDYVKIKNHIMKTTLIKADVELLAADVTDDQRISALDYVRVKNHIMNGGN